MGKPTPTSPPLSRFRAHGSTIYVSGQVPLENGVVISAEFGPQVAQVLKNLDVVLSEAGSSRQDVLKCTCYLRREQDLPEFNAMYREYFGAGTFPARTTVIAAPPNPAFLVEIEAVARISEWAKSMFHA